MTRLISIYFALLISQTVLAADTAPQLRSAAALTSSLQKDQYSADLKEGFHFNDKAPNQVQVDGQVIKPLTLQARAIRFQLPKSYKEAQALLYVCDDQITFCETHKLTIKGSETTTPAAKKSQASTVKKDEFGFWEGHLDQALAEAKKKNQLLLLDFTARWCPGCVRNKKEIFSTSGFKKVSKKFIKVKIDVDLFDHFPLTEKYQIKGIPTLVLVNANDEEIDRIVDFQPLTRIEFFLKSAEEDSTPIQALLKVGESADTKTQLKAGLRLFAAGKDKESIPFLTRVQPVPPELLAAKVAAAQEDYEKDNAGKKESYANELRSALKAEPTSTRSLVWRTELVKLNPKSDEAKALTKEGTALADELLEDEAKLMKAVATDSIGEFKGYEKWVAAINKADLLEAAGAAENDQLKAINQAADLGIAYKIPASKSGPALRQLTMLTAAKRWNEADTQANLLLKAEPNNTDIKRRKIKILNSLKRFDEAIALGERILPQSEGRNEFWVAEALAKSYVGSNKKDSAKRLLTAYLARPEIQSEKMKSTRTGFEELLKSLP